MKRIALMFALFFLVALIFPADAPAPNCGDNTLQPDRGEVCDGTDDEACPGECLSDCTCPEVPEPYCGDGMINLPGEDCDVDDAGYGDDSACPGECVDCTCPPPPKCGDGIINLPGEDCDVDDAGYGDDSACPGKCVDCTCPPPGMCAPMTQGFWKRICDGKYGVKKLHPETPEGFDSEMLCNDFRGFPRSNPCVKADSQVAALMLNIAYSYLDTGCEIYYEDDDTLKTVDDALKELADPSISCKDAADLAEAINSRKAL